MIVTRKKRCSICKGPVQVFVDAENGPSPYDVFDNVENLCDECLTEADNAAMDSECLSHRKPVGLCWECFKDDEEVTV